MKPAIEVHQLSKCYDRKSFFLQSFRERFAQAWREVVSGRIEKEAIWVLKDINFNINPGEAVGLVGKNGAGKTTLLRILSRLTEPSSGNAKVRGRVASLLEMGSGFHPDLTGRENIFLNGAFLGMRRREVAQKLDAILAFSELESFLDVPMKKYSRGMVVRLAFAVAIHLDADILLMDELLDAGDARFQALCLQRLNQLKEEGKSILFVSHQRTHIEALCPRSLLLEGTTILRDGPTSEILAL